METIRLQFQTPQDFQGFRKLAGVHVISSSIQNLEVLCTCEMKQIADAITKFGAVVIDEKG